MRFIAMSVLTAALAAPAIASGQAGAVSRLTNNPVDFSEGVLQPTGAPFRTASQAIAQGATLNGDAFSSAVLGENTSSAFFLDDFPDDFVFDGAAEDGGIHLIPPSPGTSVIEFVTQTGPNQFLYQVNAFTNDGSDWLPANVDPGDGDFLTTLRMDVGDVAVAGTLPGDDPIDDARIAEVTAAVFGLVQGTDITAFEMFADTSTPGSLSGVGLVGNAAGQGVTEMFMAWQVSFVPAPGPLALVGLSGLIAIRRRR